MICLLVVLEGEVVVVFLGFFVVSFGFVVFVVFVEIVGFFVSGGEIMGFVVFVDGVDDLVDVGVVVDGGVLGVDEDDFVVFVGRVLVDLVGVEDVEVGVVVVDMFFGGGFEGVLVFELVDILVGGFVWRRGLVFYFIGGIEKSLGVMNCRWYFWGWVFCGYCGGCVYGR